MTLQSQGKFPITHKKILQVALGMLTRRARSSDLGVNSELVLFSRDYKVAQENPPRLNGTEIAFPENAKYQIHVRTSLERKC